ncbi:MAG: hypothetical protein ACRDGM_11045, partial [bacterium]
SVTPTTLAKARYAAHRRRKGKPIPPEPILSLKVRSMVKSILKSIAFMKAGWLPAYLKLKRKQIEATIAASQAFGGRDRPGYGDATPAHTVSDGWEGAIENASVNPMDSGSWPALEKYGGEGLARAVYLVRNDMEEYLQREHDKAANAFNA